jgi:hypothetical protein
MPIEQPEAGTVSAEQALLLLLLDKPADLKRLEREGAIKPTSSGRYWLRDLVQGYVKHLRRDVPVSVAAMGEHIACAPAYVRKLAAAGTIERRADGRFDLDKCRAQYIASLREARKLSLRGTADAEFAAAKAELIRIRIMQQRGKLMLYTDHAARVEAIAGVILSALSSLPAQCAPTGDLPTRRKLEKWVRDVRIAIAKTMNGIADAEGEEAPNGTQGEVRSMPARERVGV